MADHIVHDFASHMKISVIAINRNNAEGLRKTIESVISQTEPPFEFIVIENVVPHLEDQTQIQTEIGDEVRG